jgi:hypothetical protein
VPFLKLLFQPVEGQVIVETSQDDIDGQTQSQLALRDQARGQRCDRHTRLTASAGVLGPHSPAADELGRYYVDLFGNLLSDSLRHFPAARTGR